MACRHLLSRSAGPCGYVSASVSQITEGHLSVRANLGDDAHTLRLLGHRVDIGQWLLVGLSRHNNLFTLRLERGGGSREAQALLGSGREILIHPTSVTVANGPTAADEDDFQGEVWVYSWTVCDEQLCVTENCCCVPGCLRDVRFNGHVLPLDGQSRDLVTVLERRGVVPGCSSDACSSQPCRGPLRCVDLWRKHQCR